MITIERIISLLESKKVLQLPEEQSVSLPEGSTLKL